MKVLAVSNMYPWKKSYKGIFVKQQLEQLEKKGVKVIRVVKKRPDIFGYIPFFLQYMGCLLFRSYDLVHAYYGFHSALPAALIKFKPLVITFVGSDALREPRRSRVYALLQKFVVRRADIIVAVSEGVRDALVNDLKGDLRKIVVVNFGVDLEMFRPVPREVARRNLGLPLDKKLILFPSSPERGVKRYDIFLEVIKVLRQEDSEIEPVILSGNGRSYYEIPLVMSACDVLVLTSDSEGSPQVIKEAMACNLPIVSVDVGDVRELLRSTENCYVCPREVREIARAVKLALGNNQRTNGRERVAHLSQGEVTGEIVGLYGTICTRSQ